MGVAQLKKKGAVEGMGGRQQQCLGYKEGRGQEGRRKKNTLCGGQGWKLAPGKNKEGRAIAFPAIRQRK